MATYPPARMLLCIGNLFFKILDDLLPFTNMVRKGLNLKFKQNKLDTVNEALTTVSQNTVKIRDSAPRR